MATVAAMETTGEEKEETNTNTYLKASSVPEWRNETNCENQEYFRLGGRTEPQQKQPVGALLKTFLP